MLDELIAVKDAEKDYLLKEILAPTTFRKKIDTAIDTDFMAVKTLHGSVTPGNNQVKYPDWLIVEYRQVVSTIYGFASRAIEIARQQVAAVDLRNKAKLQAKDNADVEMADARQTLDTTVVKLVAAELRKAGLTRGSKGKGPAPRKTQSAKKGKKGPQNQNKGPKCLGKKTPQGVRKTAGKSNARKAAKKQKPKN